MRNFITLFFLLISAMSFAATNPQAAYAKMKEGKAVIVDVREKDEIQQGMIKDALWFPLSKIENNKNWKKDFMRLTKGKEIFLYCRSGRRTGKVMSILKTKKIDSQNLGGFETLQKELPTSRPR